MTVEKQQLTFKWLVGVLGAVVFFGFTAWISNIHTAIADLQQKASAIDSVQVQLTDIKDRVVRIENKVDSLQK